MTTHDVNDPQQTPDETGPAPAEAGEGAEGASTGAAEAKADTRIAKLEAEVAALKDQHLRSLAEVENVRRRAQREREDTAKFAISAFAKELLAVADNLGRALAAVPAEARAGDESLNNLMVGVEATERQMFAGFERVGIKRLEPMGQPFDPNFHQVVFEVENTGQPAGVVIQVLQPGYTLHGRLLREAMVGVAKGAPSDAARVDTTA
ncbi:MAG: nucleotide exchange factor GrpE [Azospirillum sp.]|nr:nucleotide exchange factor GrpE [Azospirillum sp.]